MGVRFRARYCKRSCSGCVGKNHWDGSGWRELRTAQRDRNHHQHHAGEIKTDGYGEFVITRLSPRVYKVRIQKPGFAVKDLDVSVEAGSEASLDHVVLEVKLPPV